jgi:hypothetical protein
MNNQVVSIVRETNANKMISRLNLRIRLSYARAQLTSKPLAGGFPAAPIDPGDFTYHFL